MHVFVHGDRKDVVIHTTQHDVIARCDLRVVGYRNGVKPVLLILFRGTKNNHPNRFPLLSCAPTHPLVEKAVNTLEILQDSAGVAFAGAAIDLKIRRWPPDPLGIGSLYGRENRHQSSESQYFPHCAILYRIIIEIKVYFADVDDTRSNS